MGVRDSAVRPARVDRLRIGYDTTNIPESLLAWRPLLVHPVRMTLTTSTLDSVIVIWHVAVNNGDSTTAAAACTEDVRLGGPQGDASGRDEMRRWVEGAGVRLMPRDCYDVPGGIVVAQDASWKGQGQADPVTVYSTFGLRNGSISSIHRFPTLEEARAFSLVAA